MCVISSVSKKIALLQGTLNLWMFLLNTRTRVFLLFLMWFYGYPIQLLFLMQHIFLLSYVYLRCPIDMRILLYSNICWREQFQDKPDLKHLPHFTEVMGIYAVRLFNSSLVIAVQSFTFSLFTHIMWGYIHHPLEVELLSSLMIIYLKAIGEVLSNLWISPMYYFISPFKYLIKYTILKHMYKKNICTYYIIYICTVFISFILFSFSFFI